MVVEKELAQIKKRAKAIKKRLMMMTPEEQYYCSCSKRFVCGWHIVFWELDKCIKKTVEPLCAVQMKGAKMNWFKEHGNSLESWNAFFKDYYDHSEIKRIASK